MADCRFSRIHQRRLGLNDDRFAHAGEGQLEVHLRLAANRQRDAFAKRRLKSLQLRAHFVFAEAQGGRAIRPGRFGQHGARLPRVVVLHGDGHTRQRSAGCVGDRAEDRAGDDLSICDEREERDCQHYEQPTQAECVSQSVHWSYLSLW